jgi:DNA gyrase subunit A
MSNEIINENNNDDNENKEHIKNQDIRDVIKQKYLDYSMSVIVDRALPDIRDGLKPVHRRILFSMYDLDIKPNGPYKKSARVVGDVIGKYHPHGDSSVYDAKVRLAQPFSMRALLVDGQGNYGSIDGDNAAAMRYTETRLHKNSMALFSDIEHNTVNYRPNYDGSEYEPEVLPLRFPNLVINGVQGIAVGMASKIPPHNPIEALECVKKIAENLMTGQPHVIEDLMKIMPAPDFPTGGIIHGAKNMYDAWTTGRANMKLRARWHEEEIDRQTVLVIDQIPYQVNKLNLIERLIEITLPNQDKDSPNFGKSIVDGVEYVREESDKNGIRIAIYLKRDAEAEIVFNTLAKYSSLEESINYNSTVLVNNRPKVVGLLEMFESFINHRLEVILRRTTTLNNKASARLHILEGLMKAVDPKNIERVIEIVRQSTSPADAKFGLITFLAIDDIQAAAILDLRLQKLTSMQLSEMAVEFEEIKITVADYNDILNNVDRRFNIVIEESDEQITRFATAKEKESFYGNVYAYKDRLSDFHYDIIKNDLAALTKEEECTIMYSSSGYISRVSLDEFESQNRGTRGKKKMKLKKEDSIAVSIQCHSHSSLMFITNKGKAYTINAYELPSGEKGRHINNVLDSLDDNEVVIKMLAVDFEKEDTSLIMVTKDGKAKMTALSEYQSSMRKGGIIGIKLLEGDSIVFAGVCSDDDQLLMLNNSNKSIRFPVTELRKLSRNSMGVTGMKLDNKEKIIGGSIVNDDNGYMVCVSENGLIKITEMSQYRIQGRGGKGLRAMKSNERSGSLFAALFTSELDVDLITTTKSGMNNRISLSNINVTSRNTTGVSLVKLEDKDQLVSIFVVDHEEFEENEEDLVDNVVEETENNVSE